MELPTQDPRSASRVVRTIHQVVLAVAVSLLPALTLLEVPAATVGKVGALVAILAGLVARVYNVVWPAEEDLPVEF